jgi:AraC-like DNA-binding protein
LAWVIENVVEADTEFPHSSYPNTIIWIVLEGTRTIELDGERYQVQAGDVVVIPPQTPRTVLTNNPAAGAFHYYTIGCDLKVGSLHFVEQYKLPLLTRIEDQAAFQDITALTAELLAQALDVIRTLHALDQPQLIIGKINTDETVALLAVNATFNLWIARFLQMMREHMADKPQEIDPRVNRLCAYMQANLDRRLTLSDLAQYVYVSESHLRLLFRKTMGISPSDYLCQLRLQRVKELLVNTAYPLKEIAERSGFQTLNHFSRMFKKYESMSPTEYRRRYFGLVQG